MADKISFLESHFIIDLFYNIILFYRKNDVTAKFKVRKKPKKHYVLLNLTSRETKYVNENQPYKNKMRTMWQGAGNS